MPRDDQFAASRRGVLGSELEAKSAPSSVPVSEGARCGEHRDRHLLRLKHEHGRGFVGEGDRRCGGVLRGREKALLHEVAVGRKMPQKPVVDLQESHAILRSARGESSAVRASRAIPARRRRRRLPSRHGGAFQGARLSPPARPDLMRVRFVARST